MALPASAAAPAVGQQIPCGEDPHGQEGHQGHQVDAAGEHLNGVLQHPMDLENGLQQGQGQQEQLTSQQRLAKTPLNVLKLGFRVGLQRDGVQILAPEDLHLIPAGGSLPARLGAVVLKGIQPLCRGGGEVSGPGKVGDGEFQPPGLGSPIGPLPGPDGFQHPSLFGHAGQMGGDGAPVQEAVQGHPLPFSLAHIRFLLP